MKVLLLILILLIVLAILVKHEKIIVGGINFNPISAIKDKLKKVRYNASIREEIKTKEAALKKLHGEENKVILITNKILDLYATGAAKILMNKYCKNGVCDLNKLWDDKCGPDTDLTSDEYEHKAWENSLFCSLGEGNELASLIFRLQFTIPEHPQKHALYNFINKSSQQLTGDKQLDPMLHEFVTTLFAKVNRKEKLRWVDLPTYAVLATKFSAIKDKYIEPALKEYGLSLKKQPRDNTQMHNPRSVDLNSLAKKYCGNTWQDTLFCALAGNKKDHYVAQLLGTLKFQVPPEPNKHIIARIIEIVRKNLQEPDKKTGKQTWTNYAIEKAFNSKVYYIMEKINKNQPLRWEDLNDLFIIGSFLGVGGWNMTWLVEIAGKSKLADMGLGIAETPLE